MFAVSRVISSTSIKLSSPVSIQCTTDTSCNLLFLRFMDFGPDRLSYNLEKLEHYKSFSLKLQLHFKTRPKWRQWVRQLVLFFIFSKRENTKKSSTFRHNKNEQNVTAFVELFTIFYACRLFKALISFVRKQSKQNFRKQTALGGGKTKIETPAFVVIAAMIHIWIGSFIEIRKCGFESIIGLMTQLALLNCSWFAYNLQLFHFEFV